MNKRFYSFGEYRLDTHNQRLLREGETITLTLKEFELLFALIENAGDVVSKDDLLDRVWKDVSVAEETLTRNISWLRKKLGDGKSYANFIETVPKRGYRFVAQVKQTDTPEIIVEEQTRTHIRVEETLTFENETTMRPKEDAKMLAAAPNVLPSRFQIFALLLLLVLAAGFAVYQIYFRSPESKTSVAVRVVPFSGSLGRENYPAFSPDGKQLAFAWNGGEADNLDIYVRLINAGEPIRLTDTEFAEQHPTFSPDGTHIAFVRSLKTGGEVVLIPAFGGAERRITKLFSGFASVSFSPDGKTIAVIDTEDSTTEKHFGVFLVNLQNGERVRLNALGEYSGETTPRFSPDGKSLAFVRIAADNMQDLFISSTNGEGEPRQITFDKKTIHSLAWSSDGSEIFFVSYRNSIQTNVWRVAVSGGEPELIATGGNKDITNLAASSNGKTIAFVENTQNLDIWRTEKNQTTNNQTEKKFIGSTYSEFSPNLSPDGTRLIFVSNRTGKTEIWMSDTNGKNLRQITSTEFVIAEPRFSPDGANIVYFAKANGNANIFSISADGGTPKLLTADTSEERSPVWSADGASIYFISDRTGENQIWKISATSGVEAIQITRQGAFQIVAAPPNGNILFTKENNAAVWRTSANGENEQLVPELSTFKLFGGNWSATPRGFYFLATEVNKSLKIKFYEFSNGKVVDAANDKLPENFYGGIAVSADGNNFFYARQDQNASSIMFIEIGE